MFLQNYHHFFVLYGFMWNNQILTAKIKKIKQTVDLKDDKNERISYYIRRRIPGSAFAIMYIINVINRIPLW